MNKAFPQDPAAIAHRYRFLRREGGGPDALQLAGLMPAQGDFVHVRAIVAGDLYGHDSARRVLTPEGNQVRSGKIAALAYEVLSVGADAAAKRPDIVPGVVVDHLASAADMVHPEGSRVCAYVPVDFIPYALDPAKAGAWYDAQIEKADALEKMATKTLAEERAKLVKQANMAPPA